MTRVLIVDDKEENLYYLQALLAGNGCTVVAARHGAEALIKARQQRPELIISDLLMPVMDGFTLLRHWKADSQLKEIPFIVYTATYTEAEDERLALSLGADAFVLKPAEPEDFLARIRAVQTNRVAAIPTPPKHQIGDEKELLKIYSETLIRKLEEKMLLLEEANRTLERDITDRKETENKIREQAALLDIAHEAILVKDLSDRIIFWNKGAERTYGWTATEALGRKSAELLHRDPTKFQEARKNLLAKGEWQGELSKQTKHGRELTVEVRWTMVHDARGEPKSILAINTDITEKKRLEAQFLRAQRMESIGTLAGGVAHDLNNILAPVLMSVQILKLKLSDPEDQYLLTTLETGCKRGAELVKQVLSFARGVAGQRITVNPVHLMNELMQVMRDTFPKNLDVRFVPASDLWTVTGDPTQLHQVFLNLCVNARDAMPQGGTLSITMQNVVVDDTYAGMNLDSKPGPYVVVEVEDTGCGIPPDVREKIFEPFFTTKELGKGTGLGLSTTLAIVRSHGGFINLYSELGRGSRFKVYVPANTTEIAAEQVAGEQPRLPHGHGELVLVVDDEEAIRQVAQRTLERFGYRVLAASHGAEAVSIYVPRQQEIAVVLTDMAMPIMDGPALIIALKSINPRVRIIGSSGLTSSDGIAKAVGAGVAHFIPKPYTTEAILKTLRDALHGGPPAHPPAGLKHSS